MPLLLKTVGAEESSTPNSQTILSFLQGGFQIIRQPPIQPTTLTWCTEPLGDNRYFAVTDDGVVTRNGESGEPLGQEGTGADLLENEPTS